MAKQTAGAGNTGKEATAKAAAEKAEQEAAAKAAAEKAEQEAATKAAAEKAEQEAATKAAAEKAKGNKPSTVPAVCVRAKTPGFRRGGRAWPATETVVPISDFTDEQIQAIKNEAELIVTETEIEATQAQE